MLEDVQERLVYRTHIYIREEILNYNASPGDLSYPEKLEIMEKIALEQEQQRQMSMKRSESTSSGELSMSISSETNSLAGDLGNGSTRPSPSHRLSPQDQHGMWFPTLRRTLICMSKLYRCLDVTYLISSLKFHFCYYQNCFLIKEKDLRRTCTRDLKHVCSIVSQSLGRNKKEQG